MTGAGRDRESDNTGDSGDYPIHCYCLPCLHCGRGDKGRANVRTAIFLITVPFFLLFFFLLDDFGHIITRNVRARSASRYFSHNTPIDMLSDFHPDHAGMKVVHSLHFRRQTMHEWPNFKRDILIRRPEKYMNVEGDTFEVTMHCPRGVLYLFHGCGRYAASFFYSPQGRRMVSMALDAGLVVVAFTKEEEVGCWDWEKDGETVLKIGKKFMMSRLAGVCTDSEGTDVYPPIFGFGASSGGSFVATLASEMKKDPESYEPFVFSAINVQIMAPRAGTLLNTPTIFTVMNGDEATKQRVQEFLAGQDSGSPFEVIETSGRKQLDAFHFSHVFKDDPQMTDAISKQVYKDLCTLNVIDSSTSLLSSNPRFSEDAIASVWQKFELRTRREIAQGTRGMDPNDVLPFGVSKRLLGGLEKNERLDSNSIWLIEELNVAWDDHEITAEGFDDVLVFFLKHGSPPWTE